MEKFTKLNEKLRKIDINIINSTEKIYFAYIIGWQENGLTLTATNQTIGNDLGMTKDGIKTLNNKCNKFFDFFSTIQVGIQTVNDKTSSSHIIKIDIDLFEKFLDNPIKPIRSKKEAPKKASNEVKLKSEVVIPEVIKEAPQSMFGEQRDIFQQLEEYNSEADYKSLIKDTYSNITFRGFFIKEKHLGVWDLIQDYKGVMNSLIKNNNQIAFDIDMDKYYESYKDRVIQIN